MQVAAMPVQSPEQLMAFNCTCRILGCAVQHTSAVKATIPPGASARCRECSAASSSAAPPPPTGVGRSGPSGAHPHRACGTHSDVWCCMQLAGCQGNQVSLAERRCRAARCSAASAQRPMGVGKCICTRPILQAPVALRQLHRDILVGCEDLHSLGPLFKLHGKNAGLSLGPAAQGKRGFVLRRYVTLRP